MVLGNLNPLGLAFGVHTMYPLRPPALPLRPRLRPSPPCAPFPFPACVHWPRFRGGGRGRAREHFCGGREVAPAFAKAWRGQPGDGDQALCCRTGAPRILAGGGGGNGDGARRGTLRQTETDGKRQTANARALALRALARSPHLRCGCQLSGCSLSLSLPTHPHRRTTLQSQINRHTTPAAPRPPGAIARARAVVV